MMLAHTNPYLAGLVGSKMSQVKSEELDIPLNHTDNVRQDEVVFAS